MWPVRSGHLCLHANDVWRLCVRLGEATPPARPPDRARLRAELEGVLEWVNLANIDKKVWTEKVEMMVDRFVPWMRKNLQLDKT